MAFVYALILVSIVSFMLSTEPSLAGLKYQWVFDLVEVATVAVFSVEYLGSILTSWQIWV